MTAQPREQPAPCQVCRTDTWAPSAVCDDCTGRASHAAGDPTGYAAAVRNAGVREALRAVGFRWLPREARIMLATEVLLESCKRQARVLP